MAARPSVALSAHRGNFKRRAGNIDRDTAMHVDKFIEAADDLFMVLGSAPDLAAQSVDKMFVDLFAEVVRRTPVDTGRAAAGWRWGRNAAGRAGARPDASVMGRATTSRTGRFAWTIWNPVPYVVYLEYGWSRQAPRGMLRVAFSDLAANLRSRLAVFRGT